MGAVSKYSHSFRQQVAMDYEKGDLSYLQVAEKYGLKDLITPAIFQQDMPFTGTIHNYYLPSKHFGSAGIPELIFTHLNLQELIF